MVMRQSFCRFAVVLLIIGGVYAVNAVAPADVQAAGPVCCQCQNPTTCGPPNNGVCGRGCTMITNATCDGKTGTCKAVTAFAPQPRDSNMSRLSALEGQILPTSLQLPNTSR